MSLRSFWKGLLSVFYPDRCCCCGKTIPTGTMICEKCRSGLPVITPPVCPVCGSHITGSKSGCRCGQRKRHVERTVAPFYYKGPAKSGILRLKFGNKPYAAQFFSCSMAEVVRREYNGIPFDMIIPVPLSPTVQRKRTYNQSALLAAGLSEQLGIPWSESLVKLWNTTPQRDLPAFRRSGNVLGVYDVIPSIDLNNKTVLLVDDIATTGATSDECAKMLKIYGAKAVYSVTALMTCRSNEPDC